MVLEPMPPGKGPCFAMRNWAPVGAGTRSIPIRHKGLGAKTRASPEAKGPWKKLLSFRRVIKKFSSSCEQYKEKKLKGDELAGLITLTGRFQLRHRVQNVRDKPQCLQALGQLLEELVRILSVTSRSKSPQAEIRIEASAVGDTCLGFSESAALPQAGFVALLGFACFRFGGKLNGLVLPCSRTSSSDGRSVHLFARIPCSRLRDCRPSPEPRWVTN